MKINELEPNVSTWINFIKMTCPMEKRNLQKDVYSMILGFSLDLFSLSLPKPFGETSS